MHNRISRSKLAGLFALPLLILLVVGAAAQNQGGKQQASPAPGMCPMCPQGQTSGACPMCPQGMEGMPMASHHQEMSKLIDQVAKSAAALEKENDPKVLKKKVAEHNVLVKKLDATFHSMDEMMKNMPMGGAPATKL